MHCRSCVETDQAKNTQPEHLTQITTYFCSPWVRTVRRLEITTYFCLSFKAGIDWDEVLCAEGLLFLCNC